MMVADGQEVCKVGANGSQLQAGGGNHCLLEAFRERELERARAGNTRQSTGS